MELCAKSCCCYCCHCHCHPHHHCHGAKLTTVHPHNQRQKKRITAAKRLPELPSSKHPKLGPESSQSLSSPDGEQHRNFNRHPQRRQNPSRLPEKIPSGATIAIEIDAATLTDDISYCSSISNNSFAMAIANETTNSKDFSVHCSGDNHHLHDQYNHRRRKSRPKGHHCEHSSHVDAVCCCSTTSTTEDEVIIMQRKCKRGQFISQQNTPDGAEDAEEEGGGDTNLNRTRVSCDVNESVKIKRKKFNSRCYCSSCSKCSSCSCQQELNGQLDKACSLSSSLSHLDDGGAEGDDEICSRCDAKGDDSDAAADRSSSQQSAESFCSCNSTSRCYCSCSCDESETIRKDSSTTPATMSDVSTPVETPYEANFGEDAFSMAGKSSVSQSEYFSLSSDKPPTHSMASTPMSPPDSVMPSPPAFPRKNCKHYSKHHRHKSDGNFDTVL